YSSDCALMWFYDPDYGAQYGLQLLAANKSGTPIIGYFFMDSDQNDSVNMMEDGYAEAVTKTTADSYVMEARVDMSGMDDFGHDMLATGNIRVTWCAVNICEDGWDSDDGQHVLWGTYNYQAQYKGVNDWDNAPAAKLSGGSSSGAGTDTAASDASAAELLAKSWDTIYVDYEMMVDGNAGGWLADNPVEGPIEQVELRGWAHVSTPIKGFAYTIDGGEAVRSEDFIQDRPDVKAVIHEEAEGFDMSIELDKLAVGDHVIKIYAIDANDNLVDTTFEFPFVKEAPPSKGLATVEDAAKGKNIIKNYEFVSGTNGFGGEGPENLWDGNTGTKFCTNEFPAESVAKLDGVYKITGFTRATANDNADYNGRSPNAWTISVSPDGENWTELKKGDDGFFEELNFTYFAGDGKADNVGYVKFSADGTASGTFQVSEVTLFGDKTGDAPAAAEPEPEPEPEAPPAEEPAAETPAAETPAAEKPAEAKKSGCGSMIGGGMIVLVAVLGSAWISKRR
ncbi:MAG: discoidin domain-containing protein, partial [Kiritimatiellae bacterium]|nr:discoidin domain-containing protein [Kiritimatiellia bacterium]